MPFGANRGPDLLGALRARMAPEGLNIVIPIDQSGFDAATAAVGAPSLNALLPEAAGAILVADGGPLFFSRFQAVRTHWDRSSDPLDEYTRLRVDGALLDVFSELPPHPTYRILYPFEGRPVLPFQRLGQAAGFPVPGPLGIQIHPVYGPWWAYRALVVLSASTAVEVPLTPSCATCPQPCVTACPAAAVSASGFSSERCIAHRRRDPACHESCVARLRCPVGRAHGYPREQLAFHMNASFVQIQKRG